ncbi:hypothetical protein BE11_45200 [Sorangium cellulosum]|nr:hypothetical protein BE11_45200 [Sorangium cellulosum]
MSARSKELKIKLQHDVNVYLHHSLPLCVILGEERFLPWFYQHFVQVISDSGESIFRGNWPSIWVDFLEGDDSYREVIDDVYLDRAVLKGQSDVRGMFIECLERGHTMIVSLDEYYLPKKASYQTRHYVHPTLIYGYDDHAREFLAVGFDDQRLFCALRFGYDEVLAAYASAFESDEKSMDYQQLIRLLKPRPFSRAYPFNARKFLAQLQGYVSSSADFFSAGGYRVSRDLLSIVTEAERLRFGSSVYGDVERCLEKRVRGEAGGITYHSIHLLHEHKKGLVDRLRYVMGRYGLADELAGPVERLKQLSGYFYAARLKFLKAEAESSSALLSQVLAHVREAKAQEEPLLRGVCQQLEAAFAGKAAEAVARDAST